MEQESIEIKRVNVTKHLELHVYTEGNINISDMLSIEYGEKTYYFRPIEVIVNSVGTTAILKERGYYARALSQRKDANYRDLIGKEMSIVTNNEIIKKIDIESTYC